jgi:uncharacterized membrane-anchored protein YhcB (DUF1043 family)
MFVMALIALLVGLLAGAHSMVLGREVARLAEQQDRLSDKRLQLMREEKRGKS